jgi:copper chaperone CopZ
MRPEGVHLRGPALQMIEGSGPVAEMTTQDIRDASPPSGPAGAAVVFAVRGMTRGSCANRVQRTLGKQAWVARAEVNVATKTAHVVLGTDTPPHTRRRGIRSALRSVTRSFDAAPSARCPSPVTRRR